MHLSQSLSHLVPVPDSRAFDFCQQQQRLDVHAHVVQVSVPTVAAARLQRPLQHFRGDVGAIQLDVQLGKVVGQGSEGSIHLVFGLNLTQVWVQVWVTRSWDREAKDPSTWWPLFEEEDDPEEEASFSANW